MSAVRTEGPFVSDLLDGIFCGTIELSVPLRADVVQIGAGGPLDVGRIRVSRDRDSITVVRVDGRPIQVEVVTDDAPPARVFGEPVRWVCLVRTLDRLDSARWRSTVGVARVGALKQFADVLGTFATAKQTRLAISARKRSPAHS